MVDAIIAKNTIFSWIDSSKTIEHLEVCHLAVELILIERFHDLEGATILKHEIDRRVKMMSGM
jgi:hypothetical protein